jgi:hypothetical protein
VTVLITANAWIIKETDELPESAREFLEKRGLGLLPCNLTLEYDYWSASKDQCMPVYVLLISMTDEIMESILPEHLSHGTPSGYTHTGHIGIFPLISVLHRKLTKDSASQSPRRVLTIQTLDWPVNIRGTSFLLIFGTKLMDI